MRIWFLLVSFVIGCGSRGEKLEKLEPPPEPALGAAPAPPPPPPPPPTPPISKRVLVDGVPDPGLRAEIQILFVRLAAPSACMLFGADGTVEAVRLADGRALDPTYEPGLEAIRRSSREAPLKITPDLAGIWLCNEEDPQPPQNVPPTLLEANRIAGDKQILPDETTKRAIQKAKKDKVIGSWKLCIEDTGAVTSVRVLKSTGFPAYDATIENGMRAWKYKPFVPGSSDKPVPVCTAITFIYSQR